jgi:plastocyanin
MNRKHSFLARGVMAFSILVLATGCSGYGDGGADRSGAATTVGASPADGLYFSGHSVLEIARGTWTLQGLSLRLTGDVNVTGNEMVLSREATCPEKGTYGWTLENGQLTLQTVNEACPGRDVVLQGSWGPISPLGAHPKKGASVALPDLHFATFAGERDVTGEASAEMQVLISEKQGYLFSPTVLVGSPGQQLRLVVHNEKGPGIVPLPHNFQLPQQDIDVDIRPGEDATVTVTFPLSGSLTFLCKFHGNRGQAGVLTVA